MALASPPVAAPGVVPWTPDDLHAWQVLRPLLDAGGYLPWDHGAMRPSGLVDVCNLIARRHPRQVVELGSGSSTVLLARLLRARGGHLHAIESDPGWAGWVDDELCREGLDAHARVTWVPLGGSPWAAEGLGWYDQAGLGAALGPRQVDLLVVDGPRADEPGRGLARLPALGAFADRLAPDAWVVLDDIARPGEQEVLERWEADGGWAFDRRPSGVAVGRRAA